MTVADFSRNFHDAATLGRSGLHPKPRGARSDDDERRVRTWATSISAAATCCKTDVVEHQSAVRSAGRRRDANRRVAKRRRVATHGPPATSLDVVAAANNKPRAMLTLLQRLHVGAVRHPTSHTPSEKQNSVAPRYS